FIASPAYHPETARGCRSYHPFSSERLAHIDVPVAWIGLVYTGREAEHVVSHRWALVGQIVGTDFQRYTVEPALLLEVVLHKGIRQRLRLHRPRRAIGQCQEVVDVCAVIARGGPYRQLLVAPGQRARPLPFRIAAIADQVTATGDADRRI